MSNLRAFVVFVLCTTTTILAVSAPQVTIGAGTLQGGRCTGSSGASYFKSIPYALPPVGTLRFEPPQPYTQTYSGGVHQATTSAPSCIQFGSVFAEQGPTSEDCLYLDVWAPATANVSSGFPVKVWIYGGGEQTGGISDPLYDGCNLASDTVLVSLNYRLGPLGYLALESAGIGGNQGIQDLLLGLSWVKTNVAAFGGDPDKILLFGQSAGAANTFIIATLPQAPSLINAAAAESGAGRYVHLNSTAQKVGASYAQSLNCSVTNSTCLKSKSVSELETTYNNLPILSSGIGADGAIGIDEPVSYGFQPYLDNKIIPTQPPIEGVQVPTIFGSNAEDGSLFALAQYANNPEGPAAATAQDYTTFLEDNFGSAASLVEKYYPLSAFNSTPLPVFAAITTIITDATYKCPAYRGLNRAVEKNIPVWTYLFSHDPTCPWLTSLPKQALPYLGATHTAEIPFVFGNVDNLPGPNGTCNFNSQENALSQTLISAWTAMAASGNPSTQNFTWPAYTNATVSAGINIINTTLPGYVNYTVCKLWDTVNQIIFNAANSTTSITTTPASASASTATGAPSTATTTGNTPASATTGSFSSSTTTGTLSASPLQTGAAQRSAYISSVVLGWVFPVIILGAYPSF